MHIIMGMFNYLGYGPLLPEHPGENLNLHTLALESSALSIIWMDSRQITWEYYQVKMYNSAHRSHKRRDFMLLVLF